MSKIDDLRKKAEEADEKAVKLSADHQQWVDEQITAKWTARKERDGEKIAEAAREAAEAQAEYLAYEAAAALLERGEEGESTLGNHSGPGGERLHRAYEDLKANAE
jgi:uncharacterized protein involved in type VI secretion and phage assembly